MISDNIEYIKKTDLQPHPSNPRKHQHSQLDVIRKSVDKYGFTVPLIIDEDNVILAGNGRHEAMSDDYLIPCRRVTGLTDKKKKAYLIADNKAYELGDWCEDELNALIKELDEELEGFDFDIDIEEEKEVHEDEAPSVDEVECIASLGDIWQLGNHRLMCGDSTSKEDVESLMNGVKADMIYTDPPYGMDLDTDFSSMKNNLNFAKEKNFTGGKKYEQGIVDEFNKDFIDLIFSLNVKETFLWGADYFSEHLVEKNKGCWIVWDKRANNKDDIEQDYNSDKMYGSCFELCWSKAKHKRDIARIKWAGVFGTEQEFDHKRHHPTQKPVKLSEWFISKYSKEKENILDLFGGSGSTLIACEQLDRVCYMMELDPKYVSVIIKRWENLTGKKAVKIG